MILKMFSIFDTKTGIFHAPFFMAHQGQAVRACIDACSDPNTSLARHPADYALFLLGDWDDGTGAFSPCPPENLGLLVSMLPRQRQPELALVHPQAAEG